MRGLGEGLERLFMGIKQQGRHGDGSWCPVMVSSHGVLWFSRWDSNIKWTHSIFFIKSFFLFCPDLPFNQEDIFDLRSILGVLLFQSGLLHRKAGSKPPPQHELTVCCQIHVDPVPNMTVSPHALLADALTQQMFLVHRPSSEQTRQHTSRRHQPRSTRPSAKENIFTARCLVTPSHSLTLFFHLSEGTDCSYYHMRGWCPGTPMGLLGQRDLTCVSPLVSTWAVWLTSEDNSQARW